MRYICRPGIVLTKICGEWLLIPTREASEHCPGIMRLSLPAMLCWRILSLEKPEEDIRKVFKILQHCADGEAEDKAREAIQSFMVRDLLIPVEDEA